MTYEELVKKVNDKSDHADFETKIGIQLQEVNAWTYWQGIGVRNPKVVVVGQDWGSSKAAKNYFTAIDEMIDEGVEHHDNVCYFKYVPEVYAGGKAFDTDVNLAKGLKYLGLGYEDVMHKRYPDLFFTNLIPWYRKSDKSVGGFKASWITKGEDVKEYFSNLIQILKPKIVICLGKDAFVHATRIMGVQSVLGNESWNQYLNTQEKPVEIQLDSGKSVYFFAMCHPGYWGVKNRSKSGESFCNDWDKIGKWIKEHLELM